MSKLESMITQPIREYMDNVMTATTKNNPITNVIPKLRIFIPWSYMVDNKPTFLLYLTATLTIFAITLYTCISPFVISNIMSPFLIITWLVFLFAVNSLSFFLLYISSFIRTNCRAESSSMSIVWVGIEFFTATLTFFIKTLLHNQYEYIMETKGKSRC